MTERGPEKRPARDETRCAYCVPADRAPRVRDPNHDDCLIKMLGKEERKQVALTLYRVGREEGLFDRTCPMSSDKRFHECPFYEDESEVADD